MRLKRLTLHGFKTFADKTVIEFAPGVTAIVGPNGSGKSNLLDALTWCLGEQKASNLRATRAQDVIFAGSSRRKPLGMAEVSLTVDNEDRFLPLDFAEVTVTRRIYRSGEGEYLLNKTPCRLKDITDLFLDTGVGRGAYAIVNQSEIDSILSARPEDRRELFEEAAGVKKYRVKKREAQRKLEHTETNLVRVRDIIAELSKSLAPLQKQAEIARRFDELSARLREIEVGLLAAEYKRFGDELASLAGSVDAALTEAQRLRDETTGLEASASGLGQRIADAEVEMDRARLEQQTAIARGERAEGQIAVGQERKASALRAAQTVDADVATLADEKKRLEAESFALAQAAREADAKVTALAQSVALAERGAQEAERALADLTRTVAGQQKEYLELARRTATQTAELGAVQARIRQREADIADADARVRRREAEAEQARSEAETLAGETAARQADLANARRVLADEWEPAYRAAQEAVTALATERVNRERQTAGQAARLRALEETEAAQEGYYVGVRSVMRAVESRRLTGRYQLVADALRVPAELDTAIEIALGGSLQDIITNTETEAKTAVRYLNETRGGRATFLPLDALRSQDVPDSLRRAARQFSGVLGSGADLVRFDADIAPAVHVLLARILFVDDLETATRVARQLGRDYAKIVTLSGEVVAPTGAITGGAQGRPGPNLLGRKREIGELTEAVARARGDADTFTTRESEAKAEAERRRQAVREAEAAVQAARDASSDTERRAQVKAADAQRLAREADGLRERVRALRESGIADAAREAALASEVAGSGTLDENAQRARGDLEREQAALAARREAARTEARAIGLELAALREQARTLARDADRASEGALRAVMTARERQARADEARAIIETETAQETVRVEERDVARAAQVIAAKQLEDARAIRQSLLAENLAVNERIKTNARRIAEATENAQASRLRAARLEAQSEAVGLRLQTEYDLHPDSAVALTGGAPVDRDTEKEIARLRRDIKALGPVNTGAMEEYERQSERFRFLSEQKTDLEDAQSRLVSAINEIDDSTRGVFQETYEAVSKAFSRLFTRLFGGGTTELVLTNPDDILETGVDIWAQPPGKKRQNLSLLSGGERALTAAALLFAFLEVRPAPFCVLDEVDAPLDGANVEKFADLLRDFGTASQFIVITHNATTMEAAPLWFGITMQEPGISRGLSMKVPDGSGAPSAKVAIEAN